MCLPSFSSSSSSSIFLCCKEHSWLNSPGFALAFNQRASLGVGTALAAHTLSPCAIQRLFHLFRFLPFLQQKPLQGWSEHCRSAITECSCSSFNEWSPNLTTGTTFQRELTSPGHHRFMLRILQIRGQRFSTCVGCSESIRKKGKKNNGTWWLIKRKAKCGKESFVFLTQILPNGFFYFRHIALECRPTNPINSEPCRGTKLLCLDCWPVLTFAELIISQLD